MARKSFKEEINVVKFMAELAPTHFSFMREMYASESAADKKWAAEQMNKLYSRAVPQKIGGDENNQTPIPISILQGASQKPKVNV